MKLVSVRLPLVPVFVIILPVNHIKISNMVKEAIYLERTFQFIL